MSDTSKTSEAVERLAKVIARAGLCSRRDAEGWITAGRIAVNGKTVLTPAFNVTARDKISVDGLPLAARQGTRVWFYHKPAGLVVTEKDPEGRPTIFEALDRMGLPRVLTVGRLDINTEGLLLLTNDGGLKRVLELPSTGWLRRYRVRAHGTVTQAQLDRLKDGIEVDSIKYGPIQATLEREQGTNVWLVLGLREGKNREVKNVLGALGLEVNRLIRVSYGPFQLGDLAEGGVEVVKSRTLRDQLGKKLAESAGADFESEMPDLVAPQRDEDRPVRSPRERDTGRPRGATRTAGFGREEEERPMGRPRRIHFDDDGRAPETYTPRPQRPGRDAGPGRDARPGRDERPARGDRPQGGKPFGAKPFGDKPRRDFGDRPPRRDDDRPARGGFADRPSRGQRPDRDEALPARGFAGKPARSGFSDRPKRDFGDKPARGGFAERPARGPRPDRAFEDRPQRSYGDKPARGPRPDKPFGDRPPRADRPAGDRPPRRDGKPGGKPFGDRPQGGRPAGKPFGDRPQGGRPAGKPFGGKPGGKPFAGKPGGARPTGGRPTGGRPAAPRKPRG